MNKFDQWSGSQRHRHLVGFFNVLVQAPTRANLLHGYSLKLPYWVAFYDTLGIRRTHSRLNPQGKRNGDFVWQQVSSGVTRRRSWGGGTNPCFPPMLKVQGHLPPTPFSYGLGSNTLQNINFIFSLPHVLIDSSIKKTNSFNNPVRAPGVQVENTSSVSRACRKRRLKDSRYITIVADTA